ncbi:thiosulfate sulfurtransferase GlpE [Colwellia sp. MSW7]|jgi:thiosulfate sulfurtransferase|uniref:Thiosulfate sulfurtransferase GlpE n=2 Tax=Colwellia maritima TaxID=2912588 RepID=A0ABS9X0E8_9GAMM|nr:thiosulfate sulfurtransferase GlpE [Colwellia maritima]
MQVVDLHDVLNDNTHVVVDIRDETSFANGRISNALHLTNENLADFLREADPDVPVVVCCYHGHSSQQAAQFLVSQDFTQVYSLDGGFTQWQLQYPDQVSR